MDPNETLKLLRVMSCVAQALQDGHCELGKERLEEYFCQLGELFEALDGWLRKGGFLPEGWRR